MRRLIQRLNEWAEGDRRRALESSPVWRFAQGDDGTYVEQRLR